MLQNIKNWSLMISLVMLSLSSAHAAGFSEQSVKQIIEAFDRANEAKDAQQIASLMTDDVELRLTINAQGQQQVIELSKPEYAALLQQSWDMASDYQYARSNLQITMQGNSALVTADVRETMTIQGREISTVTKTETRLEPVAGQTMITRVTGVTNM